MTAKECREEMLAAIDWYQARGDCWISIVTYIGICYLFGSWANLGNHYRPERAAGRPRK